MPINHPSFNPHLSGCTEQDVHDAIATSVALGGESVALTYSEAAARMLRGECEWEDDDAYAFRGVDLGGHEWRVHLQD